MANKYTNTMTEDALGVRNTRGKEIFMKYMRMSADEIENLSKTEWEDIELVLKSYPAKVLDAWTEELNDGGK